MAASLMASELQLAASCKKEMAVSCVMVFLMYSSHADFGIDLALVGCGHQMPGVLLQILLAHFRGVLKVLAGIT